jgi:hypothetical protein
VKCLREELLDLIINTVGTQLDVYEIEDLSEEILDLIVRWLSNVVYE